MSGLLSPWAALRELSDLGLVLAGAKLHTYVSGTPATPLATYSDSALTIPNTNPLIASAGGQFGAIYLTKGVAYKFVLTDASDVTVPGWPRDPVLVPADPTVVTLPLATFDQQDFRLTLEAGVPVSSTDQLAKTTLYCTPAGRGNRIDLPDALGVPTTYTSAEFSIVLPAVANQLYDVFVYANAGVPTLELLAWTNDTTRATALVLTTTGMYTKSGDLTRRYVASVRTGTVAGQTEDSKVKRYLWNAYNRVRRPLERFETTASWTYNGVIRQANGAAANQVEVVVGLSDALLALSLAGIAQATVASTFFSVGIGEDTTAAYTVGVVGNQSVGNTGFHNLPVSLVKAPTPGRHFYSWNEFSGAATTTWTGASASGGGTITTGLEGWVEG